MADHMSYEESKRFVFRGLWLLAAVTLVEVFFSLAAAGYIPGLRFLAGNRWIGYVIGIVLISLSLYKAKFIIFDFMHMRHEVGSLAATVLLPMALLIWGMVAFFQEGTVWGQRRELIAEKNRIEARTVPAVSRLEQADLPAQREGLNPSSEE